jgi:hypothetical protein
MERMYAETKERLAEVYEEAAEYLEEYGWIKGDMGQHGGPRCLTGAIESVNGMGSNRELAFIVSALELGACFMPDCDGSCGSPVVAWNDDPGRTADEVINTLHALANKLR